ncbi:MAG: hypothetical protein KBF32_03670 [Chitinophagales bacterium]|nr:hypothetical protein [Chitinophagaceae bacterium]MBP9882474.1 hypothetical protein [Chitinophagales bacterium]
MLNKGSIFFRAGIFQLLLLTVFATLALAQSSSPGSLQLSSVNIGLQLWSPSEPASFDKLKLLARDEADLTPIDLTEYSQGQFSISAESEEGIPFVLPDDKVNTANVLKGMRFYAQLGFNPYSKKLERFLENRELLFGVYYQPYVYHNTGFLDRDTLLVDSIIGNYAYYTEWTPVLGFTGDYIFKTDPSKRVGAYFGAGAAIGTALHPVILEQYGSFIQTIKSDTFSNGINTIQYFESRSDTKNTLPASGSLLLELRFPFGGTLRIADNFSIMVNAEGKLSKQIYFNGESFASRFGIAGTIGMKYEF